MYAFDNMIEIGLPEGATWPSDDHRAVAQKLCIGNPKVFTAELMRAVVAVVLAIPENKIRSVTLHDLVEANEGIKFLICKERKL